MRRFIAVLVKELTLLMRDRTGLLLLFGMPAALVVVVTLVQENVHKTLGAQALTILIADQDSGGIGEALLEQLHNSRTFQASLKGDASQHVIQSLVRKGRVQCAVRIAPGTSERLQRSAELQTSNALAKLKQAPEQGVSGAFESVVRATLASEKEDLGAALEVYFDPTLQGAGRAAILNALRLAALQLEMERKIHVLAEQFPKVLADALQEQLGPLWNDALADNALAPDLRELGHTVLQVRETPGLGAAGAFQRPSSTQQNVPAWTLFGMFFIVVPMAGSLVNERNQGAWRRLRAMPVSPASLLGGKVAAYGMVCLGQFALILGLGVTLLPALGVGKLVMSGGFGAALLTAICSAFAATGYGVLVGAYARSWDQAAMFGAVSVVIAAALGGIMVPVYAMPEGMQVLSGFSPLGWGLEAFLTVFVRGGRLGDIWPQLALLCAFFSLCMGASQFVLRR